ncbi:MAG: PTS sugar transporter subunit IIA [Enterocloster asparagiformis]|nr:PTS sugar transporter subunit IIA [Enterocloster asparagiformis]
MQFFAPQCFICNRTDQNPQDLIRTMCRNAIDLGFARETFTQEVLRRERMSNTAFHEVAVPHAMSQHVNRSFISVSVNRPPVRWSENAPAVKLVLMIGIHEDDRRIFSRIFDFLVEILSAAGNVALLEKAASFEEFTSLIGEMAGNVSWD